MSKHITEVFVICTEDGMFVAGDAFWPTLVENINKAATMSSLKDAKTYIKVASKRLKQKTTLTTKIAIDERDDNFNRVSLTLKL